MNKPHRHPSLGWSAGLGVLALLAAMLALQTSAGAGGHPVPGAVAQGEQNPPKPETPAAIPAVKFDVLATDEDGLVLGGLKKENFRVLDNGKPQQVTEFEPVGAPITIVMLMEYSRLSYDYFAYKAASWGSLFLDRLEPEDYVALVTYDLKPTVQADFTRNKGEVRRMLGALSSPQFQEANLYDALIDTLDRLDYVSGKKAILLIGTGANTMSANNLDETLARIKASDATIFCVGVAEAEYQSAEAQSGRSSLGYLQSKNELQAFAKLTGGVSWFPRFEADVPLVWQDVATFLRSQYRIGFSPAETQRDGKYHKLKVEIIRPDGKPLTVVNPKGKQRKVIVHAREGYVASRGGAHD